MLDVSCFPADAFLNEIVVIMCWKCVHVDCRKREIETEKDTKKVEVVVVRDDEISCRGW